jgi:zinc protease
MRRFLASAALPLALLACTTTPTSVATAPVTTVEPAPLSQLVDEVAIPYESFTLDNGLTVLVHTDRKSPVVGVTTYYRVGSKHEPRGRTGFAHLFEHLMFGGSENVENFDIPLEAAGSTSTNGSTWYDRTNYVETVPTGALDLALFMESDRMGHLLGAVTQDKLDKQRGVVQNEKRQGDNQPYGLVEYKIGDALFPVGHPYRHSTIGSMADLSAASLTDVRKWFIDNYGPNNVILALAGDIDAAAARPLVERWFGDIPRGPEMADVAAPVVTLDAPLREEMTDQVPVTRIYKVWSGPGLNHADAPALVAGMSVLGGLKSSRLDNVLVRDEQLAVAVTASALTFESVSFLQATMDVKPGVDLAVAEKRLDEVIAGLLAEGPTADELTRAATTTVSGQIGALEQVGGFSGKGATLAEGLLYSGDPAFYKTELERLAALDPAAVRGALGRWIGRAGYTLVVKPGERTEDGGLMGGWGDEGTVPAPEPDAKAPVPPIAQGPAREFPPVAPVGQLAFPAIEHATLSNGIPVTLARRTSIPKVSLAFAFNAGEAADGGARAGTQGLMMNLLEEGTETRTALDIATEQERLGASLSTGTSTDESTVSLTALSANLAPSLQLAADVIRRPAFAEAEVARVRDQQLAEISQEQASPQQIAFRAFGPLIYGESHPYGSVGGTGLASVVSQLDSAALRAEHARWIRPDNLKITAVGDTTLAELIPALEAAFGNWSAPQVAIPAKNLAAPTPPAKRRLVVIDRPNSPQSVLLLAKVLPITGTQQGMEPLALANEVVGGGFLSRLNTQLREEKGWTYGVSSGVASDVGPRAFYIYTPVQSDRTADSIRLVLDEVAAFAGGQRGLDETEFQRVTDGNIRALPNSLQTNGQVLSALVANQRLGRPVDYQARLPDIYRSIDAAQIDAAGRTFFAPEDLAIIVIGDRKQIDEQLAGLGMEIEYREAQEF